MEPIPTPPNPFVAADGAFVLPALAEWFFLPGDWTIYLLASRPAIAEIFGVGAADYGGTFAGILAWVLWLLFALASIATVSAARRFDRAVTGGIAYGVAELRRHVRMAIVLARYRRSRRAVRKQPTFDGEEPTLSADEERVLELHAKLAPGFALAVSDVAEEFDVRNYEVSALLERLQKLGLLQATVGGLDGETAYTLTANGRALLRLRYARPSVA
jgi:DNA-binding MarR family transcriptional regulator